MATEQCGAVTLTGAQCSRPPHPQCEGYCAQHHRVRSRRRPRAPSTDTPTGAVVVEGTDDASSESQLTAVPLGTSSDEHDAALSPAEARAAGAAERRSKWYRSFEDSARERERRRWLALRPAVTATPSHSEEVTCWTRFWGRWRRKQEEGELDELLVTHNEGYVRPGPAPVLYLPIE